MKKLKNGFTLAEVLITLVIIGVIAAMTIPTLMNKTNEQETVVAVKKAYSILSQAYQRMIADNGEIYPQNLGASDAEATKNFGDMIIKYLSIQKNCEQTMDSDCFSTENGGMYKYFDGSDMWSWNGLGVYYKIRLNDGSSIVFHAFPNYNKEYGIDEALSNIIGTAHVDVNGNKGPNAEGRDVFSFLFSKYGVFPSGTPNAYKNQLEVDCRTQGFGCTAWVVTKGNMDYLRKEVSW